MRINKFLALSGIASRRAAEKLVLDGKVKINGRIVTELATEVDEHRDDVTVDGVKAVLPDVFSYFMFHKPKGCVTTASDDRGRKTVFDYIHLKERVFPVGRLDYDSEGLLLFTNDGELAAKLTHPSHEIPKTYLVKVEGEMKESELAVLRNGVMMSGGEKAGKCRVKLLDIKNSVSRLEITLFEGKNREIRRMMAAIGREVAFLKRIAIGALRLGGLSRGEYRPLTEAEVAYLKSL